MKTLYIITGQTATGKTSYAYKLASNINGELVNCDSRQIYKNLNIITGKDLHKTTEIFTSVKRMDAFDIGTYLFKNTQIPLWLYDIAEPNIPFSPFDYRTCAIEVIGDIFKRNKTPIIVGGSYFYLKNLLYGTIETIVEPDEQLRAELNDKSVEELQNILEQLNSDLFNSLNNSERHNPHRLIRKIEILRKRTNQGKKSEPIESIFPGIDVEMLGFQYESKEVLQNKIAKRVEERLSNGAIKEVEDLLTTFSQADPGLQTIGYKQIIGYLNKKLTYKEMVSEWITKEIQYAKRQLTFMKKDPQIQWQYVDKK